MQNLPPVKKKEIQNLSRKHSTCQKYEEDILNSVWSSSNDEFELKDFQLRSDRLKNIISAQKSEKWHFLSLRLHTLIL